MALFARTLIVKRERERHAGQAGRGRLPQAAPIDRPHYGLLDFQLHTTVFFNQRSVTESGALKCSPIATRRRMEFYKRRDLSLAATGYSDVPIDRQKPVSVHIAHLARIYGSAFTHVPAIISVSRT